MYGKINKLPSKKRILNSYQNNVFSYTSSLPTKQNGAKRWSVADEYNITRNPFPGSWKITCKACLLLTALIILSILARKVK